MPDRTQFRQTLLATASRHALADWARIASDELDEILARVTRADARLVLERESDLWWTVTDTANDEVMMRAGRDICCRFMTAFVAKHAGAELDRASIEHSWKVAQEATEISHYPTQRAEATTTPEGAKGWVDQAGSAQVLAGGHGLDVAPDASPEGVRAEARREQDGGGKPSTAPNAAYEDERLPTTADPRLYSAAMKDQLALSENVLPFRRTLEPVDEVTAS